MSDSQHLKILGIRTAYCAFNQLKIIRLAYVAHRYKLIAVYRSVKVSVHKINGFHNRNIFVFDKRLYFFERLVGYFKFGNPEQSA